MEDEIKKLIKQIAELERKVKLLESKQPFVSRGRKKSFEKPSPTKTIFFT